ncbi:hypothetical protein C8F04DRAFT_1108622 [Mycena alexandri]|uniref:Uncharacterized protein n=1 Tax=Mycena alexandri TaxID=1745969 RepID=A0AAD6SPW6_9AGAR|nr:hypothetical protein C8F04DRAFT_1108622 [Mycena alexandri]
MCTLESSPSNPHSPQAEIAELARGASNLSSLTRKLTHCFRLAETSAKTDQVLKELAITKKEVEITKKELGITKKELGITKKQLALTKRALARILNRELSQLKNSLADLNVILPFELFDRIMKAVDQDIKAQLTPEDLTLMEVTKCNWIGAFIDIQTGVSDVAITREVRAVANKVYAALSREDLALFLYARHAARHLGLQKRYALWHPIPTLEYAKVALATFAAMDGTMFDVSLNVQYAQDFVASHTSTCPSGISLFLDSAWDPRERIEVEIAEVEADLAEVEQMASVV